MSLMFLLSGLFVWQALVPKGSAKLLRLSAHSYAIYLVHYGFVSWLQYALLTASLEPDEFRQWLDSSSVYNFATIRLHFCRSLPKLLVDMQDRIEKQMELAAPLSRVWRALTDSGQFGEWFLVKMEGPFVTGQAVGGQLSYPGYEHLRMEIVVMAIEPESYFSYTWHPYAVDAAVDYSEETPTLVEFRLQLIATGTLLTVTESGFDKLPGGRRELAFLKNQGGWQQQMESIKAYVGRTA